MFWVYVLRLSNGNYYIGQTNDVAKRLSRHQSGQSTYTRKHRPVELVWKERHSTRSLAMRREKYLKSLKNREALTRIITLDGDGLIV